MNRVAVIGGGMTGLAIAYYLSQQNKCVTIFEKESDLGGLAGVFAREQILLEKYYHHLFSSHAEIIAVIGQLGLTEHLIFKPAPMGYYSANRVWPMNSAIDLLKFKAIPWLDRLRVGLATWRLAQTTNWLRLKHVSACDYLRQSCGETGYKSIWEPLLQNKFGEYAPIVSATWLQDRVKGRGKSRLRRSRECLGYLQGSFDVLFQSLRQVIVAHGGQIVTNHAITSIQRDRHGLFYFNGDNSRLYDTCVVTVPPADAHDLLANLLPVPPALSAVPYAHSLCLRLEMRVPLTEYYWLNIGDTALPFSVIVEHTNWMERASVGNRHIAYIARYVTNPDDPYWNATDDRLAELFCGYLTRINPAFELSSVIGYQVFRNRNSQPIFTTAFDTQNVPFTTSIAQLFLVNGCQFYPNSRCLNTSFTLAKEFCACFAKG